MNKFIQNLFLILLPLYPIWAWLCFSLTNKSIYLFADAALLPIALYLIITVNKKLPFYLLFFIIFTGYHLASVIITNTFPPDTNKFYYILSQPHLLACVFFIVIEHTVFDNPFIEKLNRLIFLIVILSLVVSIIQIKFPSFFFNVALDLESGYRDERRCASIYSWTNLNSLGISFPILISILVSFYQKNKSTLSFIVIAGIIVSFLSKARYVMISGIVALSQLFFNAKISAIKKASFVLMLFVGIYFIVVTANNIGYNINDVIENRILEKDNDMGSAKARIRSYEVFKVVFPKNPWFGVGPETRKEALDLLDGEVTIIHVGYLSYLYFYGIVGFSILLSSIFFLFRDAWKVGKRDNFWGIFYGLISFCLANITFVYFNFSEMGIVISIIYLRYFKYRSALKSLEKRIKTLTIQTNETQVKYIIYR
jgi:hypothetical protein